MHRKGSPAGDIPDDPPTGAPEPAGAAGVPSSALLGIAGFSSVTATRLCDAMVPALAETFATSTAAAAAAIYAYAIAYSVMLLVCGPLGDRFGKLRVIRLACTVCAITTSCAALAPTLQTLILARAAMGAGTAAIVPLTVAWIGDTVPLERRQQALARYSSYTVVGMVLGPMLGGLLTQAIGWRAAFVLLALVFACLATRLIWLGRRRAAPEVPPAASYAHQLRDVLTRPWTGVVLLGAALETGLGLAAIALLPTLLNTRFGLSPLHAGTIAALFGVGGFLFTRSAAPMLRRLAVSTMPAVGGWMLAAALVLLAVMPHWSWSLLACPMAGFGFFAIHNTLQVRATLLSPTSSGLAVALFSTFIFVGQAVGVSVAAYTFTHFAPGWSFGVAALGLAAMGMELQRRLRRQAPAAAGNARSGG